MRWNLSLTHVGEVLLPCRDDEMMRLTREGEMLPPSAYEEDFELDSCGENFPSQPKRGDVMLDSHGGNVATQCAQGGVDDIECDALYTGAACCIERDRHLDSASGSDLLASKAEQLDPRCLLE